MRTQPTLTLADMEELTGITPLTFLLILSGFYLYIQKYCLTLQRKNIIEVMTTIQLNAEILRNLGTLAEDENMLKRVAKYLRKLVAEKHEDPTLISKEEFFASLDRGEEEYRQGKTHRINSKEELNHFLNSL